MAWLQVYLDVPGRHAAAAEELFTAAGALSVTLQDSAQELLIEPAPGEQPMWRQVRLTALFPPAADLSGMAQTLAECLPELRPVIYQQQLDDRDWSSSWRDGLGPMRFGTRLWVCPGAEACAYPDAVVVRLEPGVAFGTGTHATTAMCLEWLERNPPVGLSVIDYGCGSGILGIAAGKLGAASVAAVDIDVQALIATRANVQRNALSGAFSVSLPEQLSTKPVGLILANILANPLQELAPRLCAQLQPRGRILLTGILDHQAQAVRAAYARWIEFDRDQQRNEWVLLSGYRRPDT